MKKITTLFLSIMLALSGTANSLAQTGYTPGKYEAAADGFGGAVTVCVEVNETAILGVTAHGDHETDGIGSTAIEKLPAAILSAQSAQVDGISGATVTSDAIKSAANAALMAASGQQAPAPSALRPGVYEAEEYGNNGYLHVQVTFDESGITAINVPQHSETPFMGAAAIEMLTHDILEHQTLNVDSVAGATITSRAFKAAVTACAAQAGVGPDMMRAAVPPKGEKRQDTITQSADVVVIGAGGAGLAAAVTAAQNGKSVVILEKMPIIGGNTLRCASAYNTADEQRQSALKMTDVLKQTVEKAIGETPANDAHAQLIADVKTKYDAYLASGTDTLFDCPEWHALQTYRGGDKVGDVALIRKYTENTMDTMNWMIALGMPVTDKVSQGAGALWQRTHQIDAPAGSGLIGPLYEAALKNNVSILTSMKAEKLLMDSQRVIGVEATDTWGNIHHYMASAGVIIATGGYSNNKEMRQASNPNLTPEMVSTNHPGATGDGILMAQAIGADTTGMGYVQVYPLATPGSGALQGRARRMSGLDNVIDVNKEGKRFVNEDARRDDFVAAIKQQTDGIVFDINDASIVQEKNSFAEDVETLVKLGRIYKANTLAELAEQLGMPKGNLEKTVEEFNAMVAAKEDNQFGRKLFDQPIEVPPFYATPRAPSIHHTMGGLKINVNAQVLNTQDQVIAGLYAAGEVVGGIHGSNRLGGNATSDVLTFGRIAGEAISQ